MHLVCWVCGSVPSLLGKRLLWGKILSICSDWSWERRRNSAVAGTGFPLPSCLCIWETAAGISAARELWWHPKSPGHSGEPSLCPVQAVRWRRLLQYLLPPPGLGVPGSGPFVSVKKSKYAVGSAAGLDGFKGETVPRVGFARAEERLFAAIRVHVSAYAWIFLHSGKDGITFTSTLDLFLPSFFPLSPPPTCAIHV